MEVVVGGDQSGNKSNNNVMRDYRKGNWTLQETMVLIEAKKMDDERRMRRQAGEGSSGKPTELRWKWVEDYCWSNGCLRSQNQCNDKWDNLMRDFKKVREYERRLGDNNNNNNNDGNDDDDDNNNKSYWNMERSERKERNLPTNMLREIYEALVDVVDKKGQRMVMASVGVASASTSVAFFPQLPPPPPPPPMQQHHPYEPQIPVLPPPLHYQPQPPSASTLPFPRVCASSDPETSEHSHSHSHSDSPAKRRRMGVEGTSGNNNNNPQEVGPAISRSAALIAEAIQSCEERAERRHRELVSLHERRLQIEESKAEINQQGINGLVDAINRLANSILALATNKTTHQG